MGSNMAECHPVAFRWPMKAKLNGAKLIHIDPRFTRTSAMADLHVQIRAGSDIAFLGGLINHVINSERWKTDPFFHEYLVSYSNAATIVSDDFKDTEENEGVFSGLMQFKESPAWPYAGFVGTYDNTSWQYKRTGTQTAGEQTASSARGGEAGAKQHQAPGPQTGGAAPPKPGGGPEPQSTVPSSWDDVVRSLKKPPAQTDPTLQHPRCVFQIVKRHFSRYTAEMVERICGVPQATFLATAETLCANSGRERTSAFCYAVGWTQHSVGVQYIRTASILQLLLGNIGRPGGGILALRGHASIQGSTDIPTLFDLLPGYLTMPIFERDSDDLQEFISQHATKGGMWANLGSYLVSLLKAYYGDAATSENDYGFGWLPRLTGDHSHMAYWLEMADGKVEGLFAMGDNPAVAGPNAGFERRAIAELKWLVVRDMV